MARSRNHISTVLVTISTTPMIVEYLQRLVRTGLYGKTHTEAAERVLAASLQRMVREGELSRLDRKP